MKKIFLLTFFFAIFIFVGCGNSVAKNENNSSAEKISVAEDSSSEKNSDSEKKVSDKKNSDKKNSAAKNVKGDLKITMLNVGQGDAFLIQTETQNILIDTSDIDERSKLVAELDKAGVKNFDKIILTHPHADHIGGLEKILKDSNYSVGEIFDNGVASTSKIYLNYMNLIKDKKIKHSTLKTGDNLDFGGGVKFEVLYPTSELVKAVNDGKQKTDPNNESVVGRLVYKNFSMMFTGDAEKIVESNLWADNDSKKLKSVILKSGHHGSYTASTENFLSVVQPEAVLISAGEPTDKRGGNTYGHPHVEPLENYLKAGIDEKNIFWSWKNGTVIIKTDGKNYSIEPEVEEDWVKKWITEKKKNSKK